MAEVARPYRAAARVNVTRLVDSAQALQLLREDRLANAYLLGDVNRQGKLKGDWFQASENPCLASFQRLAHGTSVYASGSPLGFAAILAVAPRSSELYFSGSEGLLAPILERHRPVVRELMIRMVVSDTGFRDLRPVSLPTVRLTPEDTDHVNRLYRLGAGGQVTRQQIAEGVYCGVRQEGVLIAVAGTHFVSLNEGIAAVGNVFTHPAERGRGLATSTTSAVTAELLERCRDVVLNVNSTNSAAIRAYHKLGYRDYCRFVEVFATRKRPGPVEWAIAKWQQLKGVW